MLLLELESEVLRELLHVIERRYAFRQRELVLVWGAAGHRL